MILYGGDISVIYADNAATTELDIDAFEAMRPYFIKQYGNPSQPYSFGVQAKKAIKGARETIARCIGAFPEEIFFTSCGTESDNWAIKMGTSAGKGIITSAIEHHAILNSCSAMERIGVPVTYLPVNEIGEILPEVLESNIGTNVGMVSVMYANNEIGTLQKVRELSSIAHKHGALFHTDAVQAVGHIDIDVHELDVDMLSASAHKFNGPKGIGFLYIKKGVDISPYMDGGAQELGMRAGTENVASIVAMAVALQKNCTNIVANKRHLERLEKQLLDRLDDANIDYRRNGGENHVPGNISLSFFGKEGEMILHRMDLKGICISTGSACNSVNTEVSHVIKAVGVPADYAIGTIRISLGKNNTVEDVNTIFNELYTILT